MISFHSKDLTDIQESLWSRYKVQAITHMGFKTASKTFHDDYFCIMADTKRGKTNWIDTLNSSILFVWVYVEGSWLVSSLKCS